MSDTKSTEITDAARARKFFVDNYKKMKKIYLSAIGDMIIDQSTLKEEKKVLFISRLLTEIDAPASIWDNSSCEEKIILWLAMKDSLCLKSEKLREEADVVESIAEDLYSLDPNNDVLPSIKVDDDTAILPPDYLYHATLTQNIDSIVANGLIPMARKHVFLYEKPEDAKTVGLRHGNDITLLEIDTKGLQDKFGKDCLKLEDFGHGPVWITKEVPALLITVIKGSC
jgi:hypothetical protein